MAEEGLDLAAHLRHRRLVDDSRAGFGHASSTSSGLTPETKSSSVMNCASGPAGLVAWMSTVSTFFIGYTPTRAVPPQSMTATASLSKGAELENPSNAS